MKASLLKRNILGFLNQKKGGYSSLLAKYLLALLSGLLVLYFKFCNKILQKLFYLRYFKFIKIQDQTISHLHFLG